MGDIAETMAELASQLEDLEDLTGRVRALERDAHKPFDYSKLIERIDRLEALYLAGDGDGDDAERKLPRLDSEIRAENAKLRRVVADYPKDQERSALVRDRDFWAQEAAALKARLEGNFGAMSVFVILQRRELTERAWIPLGWSATAQGALDSCRERGHALFAGEPGNLVIIEVGPAEFRRRVGEVTYRTDDNRMTLLYKRDDGYVLTLTPETTP